MKQMLRLIEELSPEQTSIVEGLRRDEQARKDDGRSVGLSLFDD